MGCEYVVEREGSEKILKIDFRKCMVLPSIEDDKNCMKMVINYLLEVGNVTTIILSADRDYYYPLEQVNLLNELKDIITYLIFEKKVFDKGVDKKVIELIKEDPVGAYVYVVRWIRREKIKHNDRIIKQLEIIKESLEKTKILELAEPNLPGYRIGSRVIYRRLFTPMIRPSFMHVELRMAPPHKGIEIETYSKRNNDVSIYRIPGKVRYEYHILPEEFKLDEDEYSLLTEARDYLVRHKPEQKEFVDPKRMREVFFNLAKDLIKRFVSQRKLKIPYSRQVTLAKILVRLTVGFGILENIVADELVEDIYINAPIGKNPIFLKHNIHGECVTNIVPSLKEVEAWASRFRMISGRALDEANPVLDTEMIIPEVARSRVSFIQNPLSPKGFSLAIRRHRGKPWTLPLFIKNNYISSLGAGLLSFLIDGARTILVAGTRGAGKTSLLGSLLVEIMRRYRVITIEDTLELPVEYLRGINYNILSMKVRSAIVGEKSEMSAEDGIRTALRLGDSCLFIGEVRSTEARALYEAMRIGALANVVAGTIHGDSPYGVFDRVVNDLGVPVTSFKATDIIIIANKIRSPDGMHEFRRVTSINEVRKDWEKDPQREGGFVPLMTYNSKTDKLEPTRHLLDGESEVLKSIASRVRDWVGNWDRVWENILLRSDIKEKIISYSDKYNLPSLLEADFVVKANDAFHNIFDKLREVKYPSREDVLKEFEMWLKEEVERIKKNE